MALPRKFQPLFQPFRYKIARGGRGGAKSQSFARALIARARAGREFVLCTREYQSTIKDSVHRVLRSQIEKLGLEREFEIYDASIRCPRTKSEFVFKGLRHDPDGIKSLEGVTVAWIEEGHTASLESFRILDPTLRSGSELWVSYNPDTEEDAVEEYLIKNPRPRTVVMDVNWRDNPWFPDELEEQRRYDEAFAKKTGDWEIYDWVWEGKPRVRGNRYVFYKRVVVEDFATPEGAEFYHGLDFGFANDPNALVRAYKTEEADGVHLWVDREWFGWHTEIDEIPAKLETVPTTLAGWPIKADGARPETISYISRARQGFNISAAEKWQGSVEDGIAYLKGFVRIHVHATNCPNLTREFKSYRYKVDRITGEVLPIIIDRDNHGIDALRYAFDGYIRNDESEVWGRIGRQMQIAGRA